MLNPTNYSSVALNKTSYADLTDTPGSLLLESGGFLLLEDGISHLILQEIKSKRTNYAGRSETNKTNFSNTSPENKTNYSKESINATNYSV